MNQDEHDEDEAVESILISKHGSFHSNLLSITRRETLSLLRCRQWDSSTWLVASDSASLCLLTCTVRPSMQFLVSLPGTSGSRLFSSRLLAVSVSPPRYYNIVCVWHRTKVQAGCHEHAARATADDAFDPGTRSPYPSVSSYRQQLIVSLLTPR